MATKGEFCEWRVNATIDVQVLYKSSKFQLNLANSKVLRRIKEVK